MTSFLREQDFIAVENPRHDRCKREVQIIFPRKIFADIPGLKIWPLLFYAALKNPLPYSKLSPVLPPSKSRCSNVSFPMPAFQKSPRKSLFYSAEEKPRPNSTGLGNFSPWHRKQLQNVTDNSPHSIPALAVFISHF